MPTHIFLDANILLDCVIPTRRANFPCSVEVLRNLTNLNCKAWTSDYILAETLGELKSELEQKLGKKSIIAPALTLQQVSSLEKIVSQIQSFPNLRIFKSPSITQKEIYDVVRNICVQTKDALVILSAQKLGNTFASIKLVTRDGKLLQRGKKLIPTAHPSDILSKCPSFCSKASCVHRK